MFRYTNSDNVQYFLLFGERRQAAAQGVEKLMDAILQLKNVPPRAKNGRKDMTFGGPHSVVAGIKGFVNSLSGVKPPHSRCSKTQKNFGQDWFYSV